MKNKKTSIFIFLVIFLSVFYYFYPSDNKIVDIYPDDKPLKTKADLVEKNLSDKIIYESFSKNKSTNKEKVHVMPDPEKPMEFESKISNSIFSSYGGEKESSKDSTSDIFSLAEQTNQNHNISADVKSEKKLEIININQDNDLKNIVTKKYYYSQIIYVRSLEEARQSLKNIKLEFKDILNKYPYKIHKVKKGKLNHYQVTVGKFTSFKEAKLLCAKFINKNQNCIVVYGGK